MKKIAIVNGPNINFTGIRDPRHYSSMMYQEMMNTLTEYGAQAMGFDIRVFQSNCEGALIDYLQQCYHDGVDGVVFNPGAFTHYSYALYDAILSVSIPTVECHMSNIHARDEFRHKSVTASACIGQIAGFGLDSYRLALQALQLKFEDTGSEDGKKRG